MTTSPLVIEPVVKTCVRCQTEKSVADFHTRKRADGSTVPRGTCKACQVVEMRERRQRDPERHRAYQRSARFRVTRRERALREKFGMTLADWEQILDEQGGVCAICEGKSGDAILHSDHDHDSGRFRAILCGLCNRMLGQGQDDAERLEAGARYLREWAA